MKWLLPLMIMLLIPATLALPARDTAEQSPGPQTRCPVMEFAINKDLYTDFQGKRIYFCCPVCPTEFKQHPGRYMNRLDAQGVTLEKTPA